PGQSRITSLPSVRPPFMRVRIRLLSQLPRDPMWNRLLTLLAIVALCCGASAPLSVNNSIPPVAISYQAGASGGFNASGAPTPGGAYDANGVFMGGTETRALVSHGGKLYAGLGYWEDQPGPEGQQHAQIIVLPTLAGPWQSSGTFLNSWTGATGFAVIGGMANATLTSPATTVLVAGTQGAGGVFLETLNDSTGKWVENLISSSVGQVRSIAPSSAGDVLLVGTDPGGIVPATYVSPIAGFTMGTVEAFWTGSPATLCVGGTEQCTNQNSDFGTNPTINCP